MEELPKDPRFAGLELLPISVLEQIIQEDLYSDNSLDEDLVDYVLEVIAQKQKQEHPELCPDPQTSWQNLQMRISTAEDEPYIPEQNGATFPNKKHRTVHVRPLLRRVAVVAACIVLTFAAMVSVQAAGIDIFGALGRWTDSAFHFETLKPDEEHKKNLDSVVMDSVERLKQTYEMNGLPQELALTWLPEDYVLISLDSVDNMYFTEVNATYSNEGEHGFTYSICNYSGDIDADLVQFEKSAGEPERYNPNGMEFYLLENAGVWTAAWSDSTYVITISGLESQKDLQRIIDSVGVN